MQWRLREKKLVQAFVRLYLAGDDFSIYEAVGQLNSWMPYRTRQSIYSEFQRIRKTCV